jgi:hypothetical protein
MIKCEDGIAAMAGTPLTLAADITVIVKAFKDCVIDKAPIGASQAITDAIRGTINEILDGKEPWNEVKDASKTYEAMEALNSLLDRMETH